MSQDEKLNLFLKECLRFGVLRGFRHFSLYLRGREELIVTLKTVSRPSVSPTSATPRGFVKGLSPIPNGLPPASPCAKDLMEDQDAIFLVGGYARYKVPMVWLRSNHARLFGITTDGGGEKDLPIQLACLSKFKTGQLKVWDIVLELVSKVVHPTPENPFEVDYDYFEQLEPFERALNSAGMVNFLRKILLSEHPKSHLVFPDVQGMLNAHFLEVPRAFSPQVDEQIEQS
eukprot:TRINITY_DN3543_c0_g1_i2.p1 TRINITY_DN3543_c0_g1~~TRINITY_DN3543_c0_g1_i2.p1  ORF type:complete len:230 (-),score=54.58 TRINITY_DN3543_c0_g1_i2:94-783(-)